MRVGDVVFTEYFGRGEIIGATYSGHWIVYWYRACAITTVPAADLENVNGNLEAA